MAKINTVTKEKGEIVIRFKHFTIMVEDGKEDNFIKELNKLCGKYQTSENATFYNYKVEDKI